jgi:hypothetical protein
MCDQLSRSENSLQIRSAAGKKIKVMDGNSAFAVLAADVNGRFKRHQGDVHIGRMGRDAMLARSKNRMHAIESVDGGAA